MAVNSKRQEAHVRNKRLALPIAGLAFICIISVLIFSYLFYRTLSSAEVREQKRYQLYLLIEQSRLSLERLTFLMTGNQKYLPLYQDSAAISSAPIPCLQFFQHSEQRLLALALLYNNDYLQLNSKIISSIYKFFKLYEWRTGSQLKKMKS